MLFEYDPYVIMKIKSPDSILEDVGYEIDYSQESINFFNENYKGIKGITLDENFKKRYKQLFHVVKLKNPDRIKVDFNFTDFCKKFISYKDYQHLLNEDKIFCHFP